MNRQKWFYLNKEIENWIEKIFKSGWNSENENHRNECEDILSKTSKEDDFTVAMKEI
jgi:hypothetical protein